MKRNYEVSETNQFKVSKFLNLYTREVLLDGENVVGAFVNSKVEKVATDNGYEEMPVFIETVVHSGPTTEVKANMPLQKIFKSATNQEKVAAKINNVSISDFRDYELCEDLLNGYVCCDYFGLLESLKSEISKYLEVENENNRSR